MVSQYRVGTVSHEAQDYTVGRSVEWIKTTSVSSILAVKMNQPYIYAVLGSNSKTFKNN